jgi:4-hydroxy-tetrahydrodipicolinate reductase
MHAVRGGTIVGEHEVLFAGTNERISISHSAESREVFAAGAVAAVRFIVGCRPGVYDMKSLVASVV